MNDLKWLERICDPTVRRKLDLVLTPLRLPGRGTVATSGRLLVLLSEEHDAYPMATEEQAKALLEVIDQDHGKDLGLVDASAVAQWCRPEGEAVCKCCGGERTHKCPDCKGSKLRTCGCCGDKCQCKCPECNGTGVVVCSKCDREPEKARFRGVLLNRHLLALATPCMVGPAETSCWPIQGCQGLTLRGQGWLVVCAGMTDDTTRVMFSAPGDFQEPTPPADAPPA